MRYTVRKSVVYVVGYIWMPGNVICAQEIDLDAYTLKSAADENGQYTRESLQRWLYCHVGDFSEIIDFSASLEVGNETVEIPWAIEESELSYSEATAEREFYEN